LSSYLETAVEIAREASALVREFSQRNVGFELKGEHDLVTAADRASENLIVKRLQAEFPSHHIVAEEGGERAGSSEYRWYVDPLDGTTNFAHGYPFYCVSIGVEENGEQVCGVVYDPVRDELFSAARGAGAYCNGERLQVSDVQSLSHALLITGFPYSFRERLDTVMHQFRQFMVESQAVRRGGAAALDLCYVAAGRLDGFWELMLQPWDTAAGRVILEEAGGRVTDFKGGPFSIYMKEILASNARIHDEMIEVLARPA